MKYSKTLIAVGFVVGLIAVFALTQKCEVVDRNIHVTSRSLLSAWEKETLIWTPAIDGLNAETADTQQLKTIYAKVKNPKTTYNEFETWVCLMSKDKRKYTRQEVVSAMIRKDK